MHAHKATALLCIANMSSAATVTSHIMLVNHMASVADTTVSSNDQNVDAITHSSTTQAKQSSAHLLASQVEIFTSLLLCSGLALRKPRLQGVDIAHWSQSLHADVHVQTKNASVMVVAAAMHSKTMKYGGYT